MDLDEEYLTHKVAIYEMLAKVEPNATLINELGKKWRAAGCDDTDAHERAVLEWRQMMPEIPTKHGIHIISKPFNTAAFKAEWLAFVDENCITPPVPQNKSFGENKTVFSLTGAYLNHVDVFESCLKNSIKNIADVTTERLDDNKTIVTIVGAYDSEKLAELWHTYCVQSAYGMKCFDIHKDNPCVVYCP